MKTRVLVLHPDSDVLRAWTRLLEGEGLDVEGASTAPSAERLATRAPDAIVMAERSAAGEGAWRALASACPQAALLLTVPKERLEAALVGPEARVDDWLCEPIERGRLLLALRNGLERRRLLRQLTALAGQLESPKCLAGLTARSAPMARALADLRSAAAADGPLLLHGFPGGEQERVARAVHAQGRRAGRNFEVLDCTSSSAALDAAFTNGTTGASILARVAGGTLLLANVESLGASELGRLLERIPAHTDLRLILSTQLGGATFPSELAALLRNRPGLVSVHLPALARRSEDLPALAWSLLRTLGRKHGRVLEGLTPAALRILEAHTWPGDLRELEGVLERALLVESGSRLDAGSLAGLLPGAGANASGPELCAAGPTPNGLSGSGATALDALGAGLLNGALAPILPHGTVMPFQELERRILLHALRTTGWNVQEAARRLKLGRATIYRKIDRYGLKREAG